MPEHVASERRIGAVLRHLSADNSVETRSRGLSARKTSAGECPAQPEKDKSGTLRSKIPNVFDAANTDPQIMAMLIRPLNFMDEMEDTTSKLPIDPSEVLPGPLQDKERFPTFKEALRATLRAEVRGAPHLLWEEYQHRYGRQGLASNICVPGVRTLRVEADGTRRKPFIVREVVLVRVVPSLCKSLLPTRADHSLALHAAYQRPIPTIANASPDCTSRSKPTSHLRFTDQ